MQIPSFELERYFARYEFTARYLLSPSDCETLPMRDLLALADSEVRALWEDLSLGYTESPGHPLLRREIAAQYSHLSSENILTAAPEEAIFLAMNALLKPGDRVVTVWPAYQSLHSLAAALDCEVLEWPVEEKDGHWSVDLDRLKSLLPGARLLVLNFPHNPTGFLPTPETFARAVELAVDAGAVVFSDEMYRGLEHGSALRLTPACELSDRAVSLSGLSKAYGLAGLRTGWLATRDSDLLARCQALKDFTTICASAPGELLAIAALRARDTIQAGCRAVVSRNLSLAEDFFASRPGLFAWVRPDGGSTAFPRWQGGGPVEAFCQSAVERAGVMIVPASLFQHPGPHFRVGLGRANLPQVLAALDAFLQTF